MKVSGLNFQRFALFLILSIAVFSLSLPAAAQSKGTFSDAPVAKAIEKARAFLWSKQLPDGSWGKQGGGHRAYDDGPTALAVYALMASGESANNPKMIKALDWMAKQENDFTYCLGLRCNAWVMANKETNNKYRTQLRKDLRKLLTGQINGGYGYECKPGVTKGRTDNSNAQYGVLGTWAAARAGEEIPNAYWKLVLGHWNRHQCPDGGWGYSGANNSTATMTAGGIATLFVCFDHMLYSQFSRCKVKIDLKQLYRGLDWMGKNFAKVLQSGKYGIGDLFYFLYGIERVGLACGYKYFGTADWYKLGAEKLLASQSPNGSWRGKWREIVATSFAMLFLVRGQHAIAFNKLEFEGDWNNRPRDLAQLTRWLSGVLERTLNWQVINLKVPVEQWHDAPILYLSASDKPEFSEADLKKLKKYIHQGGTIFSATECNGPRFRTGIRQVYKKLFPKYELKLVPRDHPLYKAHYKMQTARPAFYMIHNGIRPLVLHTDYDTPRAWQLYQTAFMQPSFQIASNMVMYVTDMGKLRNRGVSHWPAPPTRKASATVKIARVKHAGNWNPEPASLQRFSMLLQQQTGVKAEIETVAAGELAAGDAAVACLTGTGKVDLTKDQLQALKKFTDKGGLLVVDAGGGSAEFADAVEADLRQAYDTIVIRKLSTMSPVYMLKGREIESVSYSRKAKLVRGLSKRPQLRGIEAQGKLRVVFSREDLTGGLLGSPMYDRAGYSPESAFEIMRNIVLHAMGDKAPKPTSKATPPAKPGKKPAKKPAKKKPAKKKR